MKLGDYFKNHFETHDNSEYPELCSRYYRARLEDAIKVIKDLVEKNNDKLIDENEYYNEYLFQSPKYSCTAKITVITPVEVGIDFNISTYSIIGMGKGIKYIKEFYEFIDSRLSFKGSSLYRG